VVGADTGADTGDDTADTGDDTTDTGDDTTDTGSDTGGAVELCSTCEKDSDCGTDWSCVEDSRGTKFCSRACGYFGDNICPEDEYYCKQLGTKATDFFCWPLDGVCEKDGLDCSPCRVDNDTCADGLFCFEPLGGIGFCVRECEGEGTCPYPGMECGHHEKVTGSICLPQVDGDIVAKCGARPRAFCEPCTTMGSCETGVCAESANIGNVCSTGCEGNNDCPAGTFCVSSGVAEPGKACLPPKAYGCHGWLSCQGVDCKDNEVCHKGYCLLAP